MRGEAVFSERWERWDVLQCRTRRTLEKTLSEGESSEPLPVLTKDRWEVLLPPEEIWLCPGFD